MARPAQYSKWRRLAMQVTLWVIFGATVGLAAVVTHNRRTLQLDPAHVAGVFSVRLPHGWELVRQDDPPILFQVSEPLERHKGRTMTLRAQRAAPDLAPMQYLHDSRLLSGTFSQPGRESITPIQIAGVTGIVFQRKRQAAEFFSLSVSFNTVWFAAAVLPGGQAISIEMECPDEIDPVADQALVTAVANEIHVVQKP